MFLGEYSHTLDSKGRLTVPARLREGLEAGLVVTRGYESCLRLYPQAEWEKVAQRAAQMPTASRRGRAYLRWVFAGAVEVNLDKLGRILVPAYLREYAGIEDEAVIVGMNNCIEIWDPGQWQHELQRNSEQLDDILDELSEMGI